jgi:hypothetical protein
MTGRRVRGRDHYGVAVATYWPFYSGKHRRHGMNLQVIDSPAGNSSWVSGPLLDSVHET